MPHAAPYFKRDASSTGEEMMDCRAKAFSAALSVGNPASNGQPSSSRWAATACFSSSARTSSR